MDEVAADTDIIYKGNAERINSQLHRGGTSTLSDFRLSGGVAVNTISSEAHGSYHALLEQENENQE